MREVPRYASLCQRNGFVFVYQIWYFWALHQYSIKLGVRKISKQICRKFQYSKKFFRKFQCFPCFPRAMAFYLSTKFSNFNACTNIQLLRRFDLDFWPTSKQVYKKLQYGEEMFGKFEDLLAFARKLVLYSSTELHIFEPYTDIPLLRRFNFGFWQTLK